MKTTLHSVTIGYTSYEDLVKQINELGATNIVAFVPCGRQCDKLPATAANSADTRHYVEVKYEIVEGCWAKARARAVYQEPGSKPSAIEEFNSSWKDDAVQKGSGYNLPLERLRYFCSIAMTQHDWLDSAPFFADLDAVLTSPSMHRIDDPDYARVYTKARCIAWSYGYACLAHGSLTRDLDLLLVPWVDKVSISPENIVKYIAAVCEMRFIGEPSNHPQGRRSWSLGFKTALGEALDPRWIDISFFGPWGLPNEEQS